MSGDIFTSVADGVAELRFNRPEARNALSMAGVAEIIEFLRRVEHDGSVRVLSITGAGEHFMAGGDIRNFLDVLALPEGERAANFEQRAIDQTAIWVTLERLRVPVVCSVRGFAVGGALSFIAGADLAIASENARFILGHINLGIPPDGGTSYYLPRAVGLKRAKQIAYFGDRVDAREALAMGLVNWVVPDAELEAKTREIVARLARAPTQAIAEARQLLNRSLQATISDQSTAEAEAFARCGLTRDHAEGVNAFLEKRKAEFSGS